MGEVTGERGVVLDLTVRVTVRDDGRLDREAAACGAHHDELTRPVACCPETLLELDEHGFGDLEIVGGCQRRHGIPRAELEELARRAVGEAQTTVTIVQRHEIGRRLDRPTQHRKPVRGRSLVGEVDDRVDDAVHRGVRVHGLVRGHDSPPRPGVARS